MVPPIFERPLRSGAVSHTCICHANQEVPSLRRSERKARTHLESNSAPGLLCCLITIQAITYADTVRTFALASTLLLRQSTSL